MAITVEEFINPKSMITPGAAAAIVAMVAGAFFSMFGIALPASLIILSFFVGAMVFYSKEFADPKMTKLAKGFFYILNSIIIFAMATGAHAVLDKKKGAYSLETGASLLRAVYAQEMQQGIPLLKQERPFFYDWTKGNPVPKTSTPASKDIVKYKVEKDFGAVKGVFVNVGLVTPDYKVQVEIDKSKLAGEVKSVMWDLSQGYFPKDKVMSTDKSKNFRMNIEAWKPFEIGAEIELESGEKLRWDTLITFGPVKK